MRPSTFFALPLLLVPAAALGQTTTTDSQTLQSLLAEVRQLRQDLRTATLAAQRAQILIYRVNAQEAAVVRASQRLDEVKERLPQMNAGRKHNADQIKRFEDAKEHAENPSEKKQLDELISNLKASIESMESEEQEMQSRKNELEDELRIEQAKLGRLQDELDRLDKALEYRQGNNSNSGAESYLILATRPSVGNL